MKQSPMRAILWRLVEVVFSEGASFVVFLILARLVDKEAFGVMAIATAVLLIAGQILSVGLSEAYIREVANPDKAYSTAFFGNVVVGLVLFLGLAAIAWPLASFFDAPAIAPILLVVGSTLPVSGAAQILGAHLRRHLNFRGFALRGVLSNTASGLVAVPLALMHWGVWALVVQQVVNVGVSFVVFWLAVGRLPLARPDRKTTLNLLHFGAGVSTASLIEYVVRRVDTLCLGIFVSPALVGTYFLASRIMQAMGMLTTYSVQQLCLPMLVRNNTSPEALREASCLAMRWTLFTCLPPMLILGMLATNLVALLFAPSWSGAAAPLAGLAILGVVTPLLAAISQVLITAGHVRLNLNLTLVTSFCVMAGLLIGASNGIALAAVLAGIGRLACLPLWLYVLKRKVSTSWRELILSIVSPVFCGILLVLSIEFCKRAMSGHGDMFIITVATMAGCLIYVFGIITTASDVRRLSKIAVTSILHLSMQLRVKSA